MDTKWKKFSRSIPVRLILNVVLIVSLVVGVYSTVAYWNVEPQLNRLENQLTSVDTLYENEALQEDISEKMQAIVDCIIQSQTMDNTKESKLILDKQRVYLEKLCENYKYRIVFSLEEGAEVVITNTEETEKELEEKNIFISYEGYRNNTDYGKSWSNTYRGEKTNFPWLKVNDFIENSCNHSAENLNYVCEELVKNIQFYRYDENVMNALLELYTEEKIDKKILKKLYGDEFEENMHYNTSGYYVEVKTEEELILPVEIVKISDGEQKDLKKCFQNILTEKENIKMTVPISVILGTPLDYQISFCVENKYFQEMQEELEVTQDELLFNQECLREAYNDYEEMLGISCIVFFIIFVLLLCVCGRKDRTDEIQYLAIDRFPTEIIMLLEVVFAVALLLCISNVYYGYGNNGFAVACIISIAMWIMVQLFFSLVRRWKGKTLYQTSLLGHSMSKVQVAMNQGRIVKRAMVVAIVVPAILICMFLYGLWHMDESGEFMLYAGGILTVLFWILGVRTLYHHCISLEKIQDGIRKVKAGDIKYQIENDNRPGILNQLAKDINSLSDGLENAVNEMMKSERLKTELISNVSHDIKTPLTSIITYVDLLKKEEVESEKAKEYIEVLDQKSQRLKILTDDLFEAAKASSGAMQMEKTTLDMGSLLKQGIGEFSEKFEKMQLKIRNEVEEGCYWVEADGRLAWRIMENIFNNVAKYALEGSRVYVEVKEMEKEIEVTVKNISSCELNISAEELMERFTRGERSRNTEGSGLGLNIAQSLAELQGGQFYVEIDGDLFKSVLSLLKVEKIEIKEGN